MVYITRRCHTTAQILLTESEGRAGEMRKESGENEGRRDGLDRIRGDGWMIITIMVECWNGPIRYRFASHVS